MYVLNRERLTTKISRVINLETQKFWRLISIMNNLIMEIKYDIKQKLITKNNNNNKAVGKQAIKENN